MGRASAYICLLVRMAIGVPERWGVCLSSYLEIVGQWRRPYAQKEERGGGL